MFKAGLLFHYVRKASILAVTNILPRESNLSRSFLNRLSHRKMFGYLKSLHSASGSDVTVEEICDIKKSPYDEKEYRVIKLKNGLKALLISDIHQLDPGENLPAQIDIDSDPEESDDEDEKSEGHYSEDDTTTDEDSDVELEDNEDDVSPETPEEYLPGIAMSVGVGSFVDPEDIQGLMHFLEHMVFMGSEKYPNEDFFANFVSNHGGSDNGETGYEITTFEFDIQEQHVKRGMDIFSQFFVSPLIKKEAICRERKAVNSEFKLVINNDENRVEQLFSVMAKKSHPISKFPWGNKKTLDSGKSKDELRTQLNTYRKKHYVAENMTLAVQARETLDTLQSWVSEIFSKIPSSPGYQYTSFKEDRQIFKEFENPFDMSKFHRHYGVLPVEEGNSLRIFWSLPPQFKHYRSRPLEYISTLLGDEGQGSILAYLKKRMWALELAVGEEDGFETTQATLFGITITLTELGVHNMDKILLVVFQYLAMMKSTPPKREIMEEIQQISKLEFDYREESYPIENVVELSKTMHVLEPEHYVTGRYLIEDIELQLISDLLSMITPENCCIVSLSDTYRRLGLCSLQEQWFGTKYFNEEIPSDWIEMFHNHGLNNELALPPPNHYACNNFDLIPQNPEAIECYPINVQSDSRGELWFRPDNLFKLPKTLCIFNVIPANIRESPKQGVLMDLLRKVHGFVNKEQLYPMSMVHYQLQVQSSEEGMKICVEGLSQKFIEVLNKKVSLLLTVGENVNETDFLYLKQELLKSYHNALLQPKVLQKDLRLSILLEIYWPIYEKLMALKDITFEEFHQFARTWLKKSYVKMLVQGNIEQSGALEIFETIHSHITEGVNPLDYKGRVRELNLGSYVLKVPSINAADGNSCVINYYQDGPGKIFTETVNELLILMMQDKVFDQLRTKEQLGYEVSCSNRITSGILALSISVSSQADEHSVEEIDNKIDKFLRNFETYVKDLSPAEFNEFLETLKSLKNQKDPALSTEVARNWDEIVSGEYVFGRRKQQIDIISSFTKEDVLARLKQMTSSNSRNSFKKISVQVEGSKNPDWHTPPTLEQTAGSEIGDLIRCSKPPSKSKSKIYVEDFYTFKDSLSFFPKSIIKF